jgi:spermidine synthase
MIIENWFLDDDVMGADCVTALKIKAKLHEEQSSFQKIAIYDTEKFGHLMTIDGVIMLTARDNFFYHEMLAHPALFIHS